MNKIFFFICLYIFWGISCKTNSQTKKKLTKLSLPDSTYDFGIVSLKDTLYHTFFVINSGNAPLSLENVYSNCGCTIPSWPKQSIEPADTGKIKVAFTPTQEGSLKKTIVIQANTDSAFHFLTISGYARK